MGRVLGMEDFSSPHWEAVLHGTRISACLARQGTDFPLTWAIPGWLYSKQPGKTVTVLPFGAKGSLFTSWKNKNLRLEQREDMLAAHFKRLEAPKLRVSPPQGTCVHLCA